MTARILGIIDKVLGFIEEWSLFLSTMAALIALFINVILRYGFNYSLAWSEELVREVIMLTTFIGCSAAIKARSMIKIDALVQIFPQLKAPLFLFSNLVTLLFSGMMTYYGLKMAAMQARTNQYTIILEIPLEWLYAMLPAMGIMMFLRTLQLMYLDHQQFGAKKAA